MWKLFATSGITRNETFLAIIQIYRSSHLIVDQILKQQIDAIKDFSCLAAKSYGYKAGKVYICPRSCTLHLKNLFSFIPLSFISVLVSNVWKFFHFQSFHTQQPRKAIDIKIIRSSTNFVVMIMEQTFISIYVFSTDCIERKKV